MARNGAAVPGKPFQGIVDAIEGVSETVLAVGEDLRIRIDRNGDLIRQLPLDPVPPPNDPPPAEDAPCASACSHWMSPYWVVKEGASTTYVYVLNPSPTEEVLVEYNFYDRDGVLDAAFSTSRLLPPLSNIIVGLSDRGVDPARGGWAELVATGPILPDGEINFTRGTRGVDRSDAERSATWYPVP